MLGGTNSNNPFLRASTQQPPVGNPSPTGSLNNPYRSGAPRAFVEPPGSFGGVHKRYKEFYSDYRAHEARLATPTSDPKEKMWRNQETARLLKERDSLAPPGPTETVPMDKVMRASSRLFKHNVAVVTRPGPDGNLPPPGREYGQTHSLSVDGKGVVANQPIIHGGDRTVRFPPDANPKGTVTAWHTHPTSTYINPADQALAHQFREHPFFGNPDMKSAVLHMPTGSVLTYTGLPGSGFKMETDPRPAPPPPTAAELSYWPISRPGSPESGHPGTQPPGEKAA